MSSLVVNRWDYPKWYKLPGPQEVYHLVIGDDGGLLAIAACGRILDGMDIKAWRGAGTPVNCCHQCEKEIRK